MLAASNHLAPAPRLRICIFVLLPVASITSDYLSSQGGLKKGRGQFDTRGDTNEKADLIEPQYTY